MCFLNHIGNIILTFWTEINELIIFSHYVQCAGSPQMSFCLRPFECFTCTAGLAFCSSFKWETRCLALVEMISEV